MSWKSLEDAAERGPFGFAAKVGCGTILLVTFFGICISVIGFGLNPFKQAGRIIDRTIDADNVLANYEWFKQRHEDIGAIDEKIVIQQEAVDAFAEAAGPRETWHREDREEHARLSVVVAGLKQQRADIAAEYNARSRMMNRSIFKAGDVELPERIE